jgi:Flp pilus assembly CpaE family ATPase
MQLADGAVPALTLDNPQLLDTCLARVDNHIYVMLTPRTYDAFFNVGTHSVSLVSTTVES